MGKQKKTEEPIELKTNEREDEENFLVVHSAHEKIVVFNCKKLLVMVFCPFVTAYYIAACIGVYYMLFRFDECQIYPACGANATCVDHMAQRKCICLEGHNGDPYDLCFDVNECDNDDACGPFTNCQNEVGAYTCSCKLGYKGDAFSKEGCSNIDDCVPSPCAHYAKCYDGINNHTCSCPVGHAGNPDDINDSCRNEAAFKRMEILIEAQNNKTKNVKTQTACALSPITSLIVNGRDNAPESLTLTWDEPFINDCGGAIIGYTITYQEEKETENKTAYVTAGVVSYELTGLNSCTAYTIKVATEWSKGWTGSAIISTGKTGKQAPGAPVPSIREGTQTSYSLLVSWEQHVANRCPITKYIVEWSPESIHGGYSWVFGRHMNFNITYLKCNTEYNVTVTAYTTNTKLNKSRSILGTTHDKAPENAPRGTAVIEVTNNPRELQVSWGAVEYDCGGGLTGYLISWKVRGKILSHTTVSNATSYTITDLDPCTEYTLNIAAISQTGISGPNATVECSTGIDAVFSIQDGSSTSSSLLVSWKVANTCTVTHFIVEWSTASDDSGASGDIVGDQKSFNITDLKCNTEYNVTVTAYTSELKPMKSSSLLGKTNDIALCLECYVGVGDVGGSHVTTQDGFKSCIAIEVRTNDGSVVTRSGSPIEAEDECKDTELLLGIKTSVCTCDTNLCNSAPTTTQTVMPVLAVVMLVKFIM